MGQFRAWRLAKGVDVPCNSLKERLVREHYERERYIRFLEQNLLTQAIISASPKCKDNGRFSKVMRKYVSAMWPEQEMKDKEFEEQGKKILAKFAGKVFGFKRAGRATKAEIHTREEAHEIVKEMKRKSQQRDNADT